MDGTFDDFDKHIVFYRIRGLNWLVPLRFQKDDLEQSFKDFCRPKVRGFWMIIQVMCFLVSILHLVPASTDLSAIVAGKGEPWNFMFAACAIFATTFHLGCLVCNCVWPAFFTETRRVVFWMIALGRYGLSHRYVFLDIFGASTWPYLGEQEPSPPIVWLVFLSMICSASSCQSVCLRCSKSWIVCTFALVLIIAQSFALPSFRVYWRPCLTLVLLFVTHVCTCFYGHVTQELAERRAFLTLRTSHAALVEERVKRYQAERQSEEAATPKSRNAAPSIPEQTSEANSRLSSFLFPALQLGISENAAASAVLISELKGLGEAEHWLIHPEDLSLCPSQVLGMGGFGSVVVGTWMSGQVAVKVPALRDCKDRHPLALEIRHLRKLRHPCIVSFLGICFNDDNSDMLLVEELVDGDNLKDFITMFGSFVNRCVDFQLDVFLDVSAALKYLHSQRPAIVHGDLKPDNILMDRRSLSAKLTDFGLARRPASNDRLGGGTREWQEPELRGCAMGARVCYSVDMWAFGAVAFFVCATVIPSQAHTIRGSSSMMEFCAAVYKLWLGDTDDESIATEIDKHQSMRSAAPEYLELLRVLCFKCMRPDSSKRPTACDVNLEVESWRSVGGPANNGSASTESAVCSHGACTPNQALGRTTLGEQLAIVRNTSTHQACRARAAKQSIDISPEHLQDVREALRQQLTSLQALPCLKPHRGAASYVMQVLLTTVLTENSFTRAAVSL
eukprot:TRINITY_DN7120_c0_g2_i1.p1 TRINITY_DN7120_c0_g2~~TRINITY_DN7120_c0_g2_i1.p1  ORF type:complete len:732 (-),score=85.76 TRINITY_DN7120_c0_g2_i1:240-2435(-)